MLILLKRITSCNLLLNIFKPFGLNCEFKIINIRPYGLYNVAIRLLIFIINQGNESNYSALSIIEFLFTKMSNCCTNSILKRGFSSSYPVFFAALICPFSVYAESIAVTQQEAPVAEKVVKVAVTGSRISKAQKEGPTSVTIITAADIEKQGYSNAFEALNNLTQNTGFVQGADYGNTFTPAANAISLRGLGPNHTLTLINGHRVADYPVPYDGSVNFVNLANIPTAMIDRIEILNGGASAIYGSDAIAGVVNVVLKKRTDGTQVNIKAGGTGKGGENLRLQLSGSETWDKLTAAYGLELSDRQPIWAKDRDFMSSRTKLGETPDTVAGRKNAKTGKYLPLDGCSAYFGLFGGSVSNIGKNGADRCASGTARTTYWTVQTQDHSQNGFLNLNYALNDKTELFGDVLIGANQIQNNTRGPSWNSLAASSGYFYNQNTGNYEVWSRRFAPEELGDVEKANKKWQELATNLNLGVRGDIGDSSWKYEAAYNGSVYTSEYRRRSLLSSGVDHYFLGDQLGVDADGVPIYAPDINRLNKPLTPAEFGKISAQTTEKDKSWVQTVSLSANGDLFELPAGTVKLAGVAELGKQGFTIKPDPILKQGGVYNTIGTGSYGGTRTRQALGAELYVPVLKPLSVSLSGRYDRYSLSNSSIGKFTAGSGFEFRPDPTLLIRGNYATSFRAPDMNYLFLNEQHGYYSSTTDYWRCAKAGQALASCEYRDVSPGANYTLTGNSKLRPEQGQSYGGGFVWSPTNQADISVDYWDISIKDLVTNLSADKILKVESDCRTGALDSNSSQCKDAIARVERNPSNAVVNPDAITNINIVPINAAKERTRGVDVTTHWRWKTEQSGNYQWSVNYSRVLAFDYQQSATDPKNNQLKDLTVPDWRDRFNTSLGWSLGDWSSTVLLNRYGKIPNAGQTGYLRPMYLVNWSGAYQITPKASVSVIVNNLFDRVKKDETGGWPYYPQGSYSPVGRQGWLEFNYKF